MPSTLVLNSGAGSRSQPRASTTQYVDDLATGHRFAQHRVVPDVAHEGGYGQVIDADGVGALPHHHPDVLAVGDELSGHMAAEVAVGTDHQCRHTAPRPSGAYLVIHSAATLGSVPSSWAFVHHFTVAETNRNGL